MQVLDRLDLTDFTVQSVLLSGMGPTNGHQVHPQCCRQEAVPCNVPANEPVLNTAHCWP